MRNPTGKKAKEELEKWRAFLKLARHKRMAQEANWARWAYIMDDNLWRGGRLPDNTEPLEVNELKSNIFAILPNIILEQPVIDVKAHSMEDVQLAFIYERLAEYIDRHYGLFEEFLYAVYDALLYGNGLMKLGYWPDAQIGNYTWGVGFGQYKSSAYAKHLSLFEVYPDYRHRKWSEQRCFIHESPMHIDDVQNNPMYEKRVTNKIKPMLSADRVFEFDLNVEQLKNEYVGVQEVHDYTTGEIMVMAEGANDWLYRGPEPHIDIRSPFENLEFMPRPRVLWGDSISQAIEEHCKELSETLTYMSRAVAREGVIKVLMAAAQWDSEAIDELKLPKDSFVEVSPPLKDAYEVMDTKSAGKGYVFQTAINALQEIIRSTTGVTMQEQGRHEPGVETLGEMQVLKVASGVKNSMRQRRFSRFASRVIGKLLYIVTTTYPPERMAAMAGLDEIWGRTIEPFDPARFVVDYGSTAMNSRNDRWNKIQAFVSLFGQFLNPAVMVKLGADAMDFDFTDELMVLNATGQGAGGAGQQPAGMAEAAVPVARSRLTAGQASPEAE